MKDKNLIKDILSHLAGLNRNIVGREFNESLKFLKNYINLKVHRYPSNQDCWTWNIPPRWEVKEAYIKQGGKVIASYDKHPLHLMCYSVPVKTKITGKELLEHIYVHKEIPGAIPYEFSFYKRKWAFCLTQKQKAGIKKDQMYDVLVESKFVNGHLSVGQYTVKGTSDEHIVFLSHIDHPCQVNDGIIGAAVNTALAKTLEGQKLYYNYTFLFVPETIGSIAFLSHHEHLIPHIRYAAFVEMVGLDNPLVLQESYKENRLINDYARYAIAQKQKECRSYPFLTVAGNDEKVFDSPGVHIPAISITRVDQEKRLKEGQRLPYPQYHSNVDNLDLVNWKNVEETVDCLQGLVGIIEKDFIPVRTFKGPVFLSKYDLWIDWRVDLKMNENIHWLMYCLDGRMTAFQIAQKLNLDFEKVIDILNKFNDKRLIIKKRIPIRFEKEILGD